MIYIAVCDDEIYFAENNKKIIMQIFALRNIRVQIDVFYNAISFLESNTEIYNIVFLDVVFGDDNGMAVAEKLNEVNKNVILIFVSAFIDYAPLGFEVNAYRYMLKQDFQKSLEKDVSNIYLRLKNMVKVIQVKTSTCDAKSVKLQNILYFEGCNHHVVLHEFSGDCKIYSRLSDIESQLSEKNFVRVQKSFIVNMQNVANFSKNEITCANGYKITCSRKMKKKCFQLYLESFGE